jgi:hypothetical protein
MLLRNVSIYLQVCMSMQHTILTSTGDNMMMLFFWFWRRVDWLVVINFSEKYIVSFFRAEVPASLDGVKTQKNIIILS